MTKNILILFKLLLLTASYFLLGVIGTKLALHPVYATAIFPSAGLALAAALIWKFPSLPAVWLGSFLLFSWTIFEGSGSFSTISLIAAILVAFTALTQTTVGIYTLKRVLGKKEPFFQSPSQITQFIFFVVPISCSIGATLNTVGLFLCGFLHNSELVYYWIIFWSGNAISLLVFTPILLFLFSSSKAQERYKREILCATLVLAFFAFSLFYYFANLWEKQRLNLEFQRQATEIVHLVKTSFSKHRAVGQSSQGYFLASENITRSEFEIYNKLIVSEQPAIQAIEWLPRVKGKDRRNFVNKVRSEGLPNFDILQRDATGVLVKADPRSEYFPVYYVEPKTGNKSALGYDLASEPIRKMALDKAKSLMTPAITGRIHLVQGSQSDFGMVLFFPVFKKSGVLRGYIAILYSVAKFFNFALKDYQIKGINFTLIDKESSAESSEIYSYVSDKREPFPLEDKTSLSIPLSFGERQFAMFFSPTKFFILANRSWIAWTLPLSGVLFFGLLSAFIMMTSSQGAKILVYADELYNQAPCGYLTCDGTGRIIRANHTMIRWTKYSHEELIDSKVSVLLSLSQIDFFNRQIETLKKDGFLKDVSLELLAKNGIGLHLSFSALALMDDNQAFRGFNATFFDISERIKTQSELQEINTLFTLSRDMQCVATKDGYFRRVNPAFLALGYSEVELLSKPFIEFVHPEDRASTLSEIRSLSKGQPTIFFENRFQCKNGTYIWVAWSAVPKENGNLYAVGRDISKQKEHEKEIKIARAAADSANQIKDAFLATLSHELRTPLTAIQTWAQLIQRLNFDPEKLKHGIKTIENAAKSQGQLIEDLLDVSRIQSGKLSINFTEINPCDSIQNAIEAIRPIAENKKIKVELSVLDSTIRIWADADRLRQIVWNLLTNAIKFSNPGSHIQVQVKSVGETESKAVEISVRDFGKGIRSDFLGKIFDRFSQADESGSKVHGGLGLGLSIARDLTRLHGGTIKAESEGPGLGSTFKVFIPLLPTSFLGQMANNPISSETDADSRIQWPDLSNLKVMIVEDDIKTLNVLTETLNSFGAKSIACSSVHEALEAFGKSKPDIIVSDIGMPGEDGYSLIRKIRSFDDKNGGKVPSIALSAYASSLDLERSKAAGFDQHLAKPFDTMVLGKTIANLAQREDHSALI